jgi:type IV secretory pathway VirB10-like protein
MLFTLTLHRRLAGLSLAAVACLLLSGHAEAQWKWRDSRGQIHISDIPPPRDIPDKDVLQRPEVAVRKAAAPPPPVAASGAAPVAAPGKAPVDPELEERRKRAEQEQVARTEADKQKAAGVRKDNCQRAREQLATLDSGQRIARIKADGEREILDDEQRAKESRRAREVIASECR